MAVLDRIGAAAPALRSTLYPGTDRWFRRDTLGESPNTVSIDVNVIIVVHRHGC